MIDPTTSSVSPPTGLQPTTQRSHVALVEAEEQVSDRRILIVDDEVGIREMFAAWLHEESFECETAVSVSIPSV